MCVCVKMIGVSICLSLFLFFYTFSIREWQIDFQALLDVHFCKWPALIYKLRWRMAQTRDLMKWTLKCTTLCDSESTKAAQRLHKGSRATSEIICLCYRIWTWCFVECLLVKLSCYLFFYWTHPSPAQTQVAVNISVSWFSFDYVFYCIHAVPQTSFCICNKKT